MENNDSNKKPKGKAVKLPETEKEDEPITSQKNIKKAQELARKVSPELLAMFEAESEPD